MAANFHDSDATLLKRERRGDSLAFAELSRKHEPRIVAVSRRILKNREDAEDNAQSTLMRAYFHCGQFRGASQFSTWLVRVAINEALTLPGTWSINFAPACLRGSAICSFFTAWRAGVRTSCLASSGCPGERSRPASSARDLSYGWQPFPNPIR
jgi:hypothetical protein